MKIPREAWILGTGSVISAGVIIGAIVWGLNNDAAPAAPTVADAHAQNVTVSSRRATLVSGPTGETRLVMTGVDSQAEVVDVSPGGERLAWPTWLWAHDWARRYHAVEPNATLTWTDATGRHRTSFSLVSGTYVPGRLTFALRPLAPGNSAQLPVTSSQTARTIRALGPVDLFVDPPSEPSIDPSGSFTGDTSLINQLLDAAMDFAPVADENLTYTGGVLRVAPLPGSGSYDAFNLGTGAPNNVSVLFTGNPAINQMSLPGRNLFLGNAGGTQGTSGGVIENLNLQNGRLVLYNLLANNEPALNNVLVNPDVSGGEVVLPNMPWARAGSAGNFFYQGNFSGATFSRGDMSLSVFVAPNFSNTTFESSGAAVNTVFLGADFSTATFAPQGDNAPPISLGGAVLGPWTQESSSGPSSSVPTSFAGAALNGTVTFNAGNGSRQPTVLNAVSFNGTSVLGTDFGGAQVVHCDFGGATLGAGGGAGAGTSFQGATVTDTSFAGAQIGASSFARASMTYADFTMATFSGGAASFRGARLGAGVAFTSGSGIEQADFTGATLDGVVFATGGGDGSPTAFVAQLLGQISATTTRGVVINNTQFVKQNGTVYQVTDNGRWQPVSVAGGQVVPKGMEVPAGGAVTPQPKPIPQPPDPDPSPPKPNPTPEPTPEPNGNGGNAPQPSPEPAEATSGNVVDFGQ